MSAARDKKVGAQHFSGSSHVFSNEDGGLSSVARTLLQELARKRVERLNILDLVDSSAGAAGIPVVFDFTGGAFEDMATVTAHDLKTGDGPFRLRGGTLPTGLSATQDYFVIRKDANVFQLALTKAQAEQGTKVEFTSDGSGVVILAVRGQEAADLSSNDLTGLTTGLTSASLNTAADTVMDAYATLIGRVNSVRVPLGMGSLDDGPGTDGTGTVSAIDDTAAANSNNTDAATVASARTVLGDLLDAERTVVAAVNEVRAAVGLSEVTLFGTHGGDIEVGLDVNQGAAIENAADGADATAAALLAEWDAAVDNLADNVALLVEKLDEATAQAAEVMTWVQAVIPQTEYAAGTSVFITSPINGRIRQVRTLVIDEVTAGAKALTLELGGTAVTGASVTIPDTSIIGSLDEDTTIADSATNKVARGDQIEIVGDATPTAGAAMVWVGIVETAEDEAALNAYAG